MTVQSLAQTQTSTSMTTGVFVVLSAKPGATRDRVMVIMPAEIRATVQLYLAGKIRQWYSRGDGRGAVFLLDTKDVAEARAIMEALPLAKEHLLDEEYIPVGPLHAAGPTVGEPVRRAVALGLRRLACRFSISASDLKDTRRTADGRRRCSR